MLLAASMNVPPWIGIPVVILTVIAARADLRTRRIPNRLTGPALLLGLAVNVAVGGWHGLSTALIGMAVAGAVLLPGWLAGWMGAGDVKLMAAVGAWLGFPLALFAALAALIAGGLIALVVALRNGVLWKSLQGTAGLATWLLHASQGASLPRPATTGIRFPFGVAVMAGSITALWVRV